MEKWWTIKFLEFQLGRQQEYNSLMFNFKYLPELTQINIQKGHKFATDQLEVYVKDIMVHMPSRSIWYQGKIYYVPDATRIILNAKKTNTNGITNVKYYRIGLANEEGKGIALHYYPNTDKVNVVNTMADVSVPELVFEDE